MKKTVDRAAEKMIEAAAGYSIKTVWDRHETMEPRCGFGDLGICCNICLQGPCRIDPFGPSEQKGVCGANADTIVARNFIRAIAGGAAAHSDHGRDIATALLHAARGGGGGLRVTDTDKLKAIAGELGIETNGLSTNEIAEKVALSCLEQFARAPISFMNRAPEALKKKWTKAGLWPKGIDREIVEVMHRTHAGVDVDYRNIILAGIRAALGDGWGGSMLATDLSDILFGSPSPIRSRANLGVIKEDAVNIVVHGHEPTLSEMVARASRDGELLEYAHQNGAKGINVCGLCCTAIELLMRQGYPAAGNFLSQELAIITGAVDLMCVDVQCIMPGLADVAGCFHTELITTSPKAKMPGVTHIEFEEEKAQHIAHQIVRMAIKNFPNRRKDRINIPEDTMDLVAGFTAENIFTNLGGTFRSTYRPLNDAIISGRLRGVAAVIGCNNAKVTHDEGHIAMTKRLISRDVLVVQTGCSATACAKEGFLRPESAFEMAGKGLQEICETVGIPPVLHLGSCVDNSRILRALCEMVNEGGLGDDISDLPVAGAAPEAMSEKAVSIASYTVGSGVFTVFSPPPRVEGSRNVTEFLTAGIEEVTGGKFCFERDPIRGADMMIAHMDEKRKALGLSGMMYGKEAETVEATSS
ncbi:MAG: anaerobic carbon-monoxide dehydrogenase catalytic subunit [Candidatus Tritonobacter lacicola]|nr:anaerobic carbon-monoxide dehydrogenase catalytic subunit [Candidatus Tritonobacter lacicola]